MKPARTVSGRAWLGLAVSVTLCSAVTAARRGNLGLPAGDATAALLAEHESLRGNEDSVRDALRQQRALLGQRAWTAEALAQLAQGLGRMWRWDWEAADLPQRALLQPATLRMEDWPQYATLVRALEEMPGVVIESVRIEAEGVRRDRRFARLEIGVRFVRAEASKRDEVRAAPSRGPLPVAPTGDPAMTRKVGAVPSLRPPSDSADPPSPGTASAPFRPQPSGSPGR